MVYFWSVTICFSTSLDSYFCFFPDSKYFPGTKTRKREREVEDAGGIVSKEKGIPCFKT
jgi:hypothetical protein